MRAGSKEKPPPVNAAPVSDFADTAMRSAGSVEKDRPSASARRAPAGTPEKTVP